MIDNALHFLALNRQRGLTAELTSIANNIANLSTPGFRREGMVFSEFITRTGPDDSLSMADMNGRFMDPRPGRVEVTGGTFDLAILGEGFFLTDAGSGQRLTRAGAFMRNPEGVLVTPDGASVLDESGAEIFIPAAVRNISVGPDGTLSGDGAPIAQVAVVVADELEMARTGQTSFQVTGEIEPAEGFTIRQGALERSNVDPVVEIARMIEVTRAYESVQSMIEDEDERIRRALETLAQA